MCKSSMSLLTMTKFSNSNLHQTNNISLFIDRVSWFKPLLVLCSFVPKDKELDPFSSPEISMEYPSHCVDLT